MQPAQAAKAGGIRKARRFGRARRTAAGGTAHRERAATIRCSKAWRRRPALIEGARAREAGRRPSAAFRPGAALPPGSLFRDSRACPQHRVRGRALPLSPAIGPTRRHREMWKDCCARLAGCGRQAMRARPKQTVTPGGNALDPRCRRACPVETGRRAISHIDRRRRSRRRARRSIRIPTNPGAPSALTRIAAAATYRAYPCP